MPCPYPPPSATLASTFSKSLALTSAPTMHLQSAIQLTEPSHRRSSQFLETCLAKRRAKPASRSPRNRRQPLPLRATPGSQSPPPHPFDILPWISALDAPLDLTSPGDIADLSQLPDSYSPSSGPGPVRRRRPSLRSNPLQFTSEPQTTDLSHLLPAQVPCETSPPHTPRPRTRSKPTPSRVVFRHLMPMAMSTDVFHDDHANSQYSSIS
ncbi:hypothetical protein BDN72DRAFT_895027 [Pluteus cervinus]|uniref:Uncharacterized protein n=1 Tax=Pluteus cervinus TaxID=181527 RepID=A0ACD3B5H5_9AGAR|nr:hypothetical protein BDN72DRAFT_895027 [Pluteus cervinus]